MPTYKKKRIRPDSGLQFKGHKFIKLENTNSLTEMFMNEKKGISETKNNELTKISSKEDFLSKPINLKPKRVHASKTPSKFEEESINIISTGVPLSDVFSTPKSRTTNLTKASSPSTVIQSSLIKTPIKPRPSNHVLCFEEETFSEKSERSSLLSVGYSSPCEDKLSRISGESDQRNTFLCQQTPRVYALNAELTIKMLQKALVEYQDMERIASLAKFRLIDKIQKTHKMLNSTNHTPYDRKQISEYCANLLRQINYK